MKKIVYLLLALIALLLAGNIVLLNKYRELKIYNLSLMDKYDELSVKHSKISSVLKENNVLQRATEATLCPNITLVNPQVKRDFRMSDLVKKNEPLLFFRFKETDCDACIQQVLGLLKNITTQLPNQRIIILSGYKNVRQFYAYANSENKLFEVYNINELPILPDNYDKPYFFVLNGNLELRDVFFYVKEDVDLTIDYLKCIVHKYWQCEDEHCKHETPGHTPAT